jgi:IS30 family transposase
MLQRQKLIDSERINIVSQVSEHLIRRTVAAELLGVTPRQVSRLIVRYRKDGPESILHQGRNKPSNHRIKDTVREQVMGLIKSKYKDCGPALISAKLREFEGIEISHSTIRRWMVSDGI